MRASPGIGPRATITSSLETSQHEAEKGVGRVVDGGAEAKGDSGSRSLKTP